MKKIIGNKKYRVISTDIVVRLDYGYGDFGMIKTVFKAQVKNHFCGLLLKSLKKLMKMMLNFVNVKLLNFIIK